MLWMLDLVTPIRSASSVTPQDRLLDGEAGEDLQGTLPATSLLVLNIHP